MINRIPSLFLQCLFTRTVLSVSLIWVLVAGLIPPPSLAGALHHNDGKIQVRAFIDYTRTHFFEHYSNGDPARTYSLVETAAIYGYALSRESTRVKKDSHRHDIWVYLHDYFFNVVKSLPRSHVPGKTEAWYKEQSAASATAFKQAYTGRTESQMAAITGIQPDGNPMFFKGFDGAQTLKTTISLDDLRATERGRKLKKMNQDLRDLKASMITYPNESYEHEDLQAAYTRLRRERNRTARPFKDIRGTRLTVHGNPAIQRLDEAKQMVIRLLERNPDKRPSAMHVWVNTRNNIQFSIDRPANRYILSE